MLFIMGGIASRDTRRISFDNTFALSNSALAVVPKSIDNESIIGFDDLTPDTAGELFFAESPKHVEVSDEGEPDYWTQRIEDMKKEHQIINNIIETEYDKQIEIINKAYEPPKVVTHERILKVKPCYDWRNKVMQCYADNPHQPLVCSAYVQAFEKSVASCRAGD